MRRFSVIIATYNQHALLCETLAALEKQTFRDFDVHVCDDGSTDDTRGDMEHLSRRGHTSFDLYYHRQKNKGNFGANLNQAIGKATGEYLVFIAADSMPEMDYLEILNQYAQPHRIVCGIRVNIDEVGGQMVGVDVDYRIKKTLVPQFPAPLINQAWNALTGNGLCVPREAFELYGKWSEDFQGYGGEDTELIARLFFRGYVCWSVPDMRLYHRWHKSRTTNAGNSARVNAIIKRYAL